MFPIVHEDSNFFMYLPALALPDFLILGILVGMKGYLILVLICSSLMANDVEHVCMCLLAICISSLQKCLFRSLSYFKMVLSLLIIKL